MSFLLLISIFKGVIRQLKKSQCSEECDEDFYVFILFHFFLLGAKIYREFFTFREQKV